MSGVITRMPIVDSIGFRTADAMRNVKQIATCTRPRTRYSRAGDAMRRVRLSRKDRRRGDAKPTAMTDRTLRTHDDDVASWRRRRLRAAGFEPAALAEAVAHDC